MYIQRQKACQWFPGDRSKEKDGLQKKHNLGGVRYPDLGDGFPSIHICQKSSNCIL